MQSKESQRNYLVSLIDESEPVTMMRVGEKEQGVVRKYHLIVDNIRTRFCKKIFLNTFAIGNSSAKGALTNKNSCNLTTPDKRGRKTPPNKVDETALDKVRRHIQSFPTMPHYCRKDKTKKYLQQGLTTRAMHNLYVEQCEKEGCEAVKEHMCRIFTREINIGIHTP